MLPALVTTTAVTHWLETAKSPRILHVFDQVCNVVDGERHVISLVTPEIGKGPFSLVVELTHGCFTDFITSESEVSIQPPTRHSEQSEESLLNRSSQEVRIMLRVGSLIVDTSSAELWNARPLWESIPTSAIQAYLPLFESKLTASSSDSLWHVNGRSDSSSLKAQKAITTLQEGLNTGNLVACQEGARDLAGLGVGLTPAGDDFLMGVMYGLWVTSFQRGLVLSDIEVDAETQRIVGILVDEAVTRTTTLSRAWLEAAGKGEAGQPWHELVAALSVTSTGSVTTVSQAIDRILSTGHTSGADALAGFLIVLRGWHDK